MADPNKPEAVDPQNVDPTEAIELDDDALDSVAGGADGYREGNCTNIPTTMWN
jgi:hypothetical protein